LLAGVLAARTKQPATECARAGGDAAQDGEGGASCDP
jgi:hypothetical protein